MYLKGYVFYLCYSPVMHSHSPSPQCCGSADSVHFGHAAVPAAVFRCSALLRLHRPGPWRIHPGCAWGGGGNRMLVVD